MNCRESCALSRDNVMVFFFSFQLQSIEENLLLFLQKTNKFLTLVYMPLHMMLHRVHTCPNGHFV